MGNLNQGEEKTVSQKTVDTIKLQKLKWETESREPVKYQVTKDELARDVNKDMIFKTSFNLTLEDKDTLEDLVIHLKRTTRRKYTKADLISEALRDLKKKYLNG